MQAPLSITMDTTSAKTALPVIVDKTIVRSVFKGVKQDKNDKGDILIFEFATLDPAPTIDGGQVNANFPVFKRVYLYDKETPAGVIPERCKTDVSRIQDACLGTGDRGNKKGKPERPPFAPDSIAQMIGKEVFITFKVRQHEGVDQNDVARLDHPSDLAA